MALAQAREHDRSEDAAPPCPCGGGAYDLVLRGVDRRNGPDLPFELWRCRHCGLVRTLPLPDAETYGHGDAATSARVANEHLYRGFAAAILADVAAVAGPPAGRFLDVGCNIGTLVEAAGAAGYEAWGLDLDPAAIAHGQAAGRRVHLGTTDLPDLPDAFRVVVVNHVLEHVTDPGAFLRGIERKLAPGGWLFVNVPNVEGLVARLMKANWGALWPHQHLWQFGPRTLRELVARETGLRPVRVAARTNLEPPSAGLKGLAKAGVIAAARVVGRGDEIKAAFRRPA